jgi:putative transposase
MARYAPRQRLDERELREHIRRLAGQHRRYGYRRIAALLRREGMQVNVKRVHRIWKQEGLALRRKRPSRRRVASRSEMVNKALYRNHVWSYDLMEDQTESGARLRILNILDEYTRECLAIRVERSVNSRQVIDTLNWQFLLRGVPEHIRSDNGPEFIANAVKEWLSQAGCRTLYIEPGSPWENAYIESFNGKFRDECLNQEVFRNMAEARQLVEKWRYEYNHYRPHSSLGYLSPSQFAAPTGSSSRPTASFRFQSNDKGKTKNKSTDKGQTNDKGNCQIKEPILI